MLQQALNPFSWLVLLHLLLWLGISARVLLRPDLSPDVRVAWLLVLLLLPYGGVVLYFLFGEVYLGRALARQQKAVLQGLRQAVRARADWHSLWQQVSSPALAPAAPSPLQLQPWQAAVTYASSVHGFAMTAGNAAELLPEADARARLLRDVDAAQQHIHLLYYIWLPDATGTALAQALMRAAQRGVVCRVLVDAMGSRLLLASPLWAQMQAAGVQTAVALPFRWWQPLRSGRFDVRNHRKVCVIDGAISHVGSQNCADAAFAIKAPYAPWVDIMLRVRGAVVAQNQLLFISDWLLATGQSLDALAHTVQLPPAAVGEVAAQVVAAGPASRPRSTAQFLVTLLAGAQHQLWISTPYFVPDATVLQALCAAAWRGVDVRLILPERNDSWVVAAASRSHYASLLAAGVQIFEYRVGLLHAKTLSVDGQLCLIGSTNIDMRSFGLNYENNMLLLDAALTAAIMQRQRDYMAASQAVGQAQVQGWSRPRRIWHNAWAALSPLL